MAYFNWLAVTRGVAAAGVQWWLGQACGGSGLLVLVQGCESEGRPRRCVGAGWLVAQEEGRVCVAVLGPRGEANGRAV